MVAILVEVRKWMVSANRGEGSSINHSSSDCYNSEMRGPQLYLIVTSKFGFKYDFLFSTNKFYTREISISLILIFLFDSLAHNRKVMQVLALLGGIR